MRDDEEVVWPRVVLVAVAVIFVLALSAIAVSSAIDYMTPKPIENISVSSVTIEALPLEPSPQNVTAWPKEILEKAPEIPITAVNISSDPILLPDFNETSPGIRDKLQYFTIHRENVTGDKDLTIKTTVYGWKQFTQVKWRSDDLGKYLDQFAPKGEKYVFVFLSEYVEGNTPEQDPRAWYFGPNQFRLQVDGRLYDQDQDFPPAVRIKDLEEVEGYNGIKGLRPFGYFIIQNKVSGHISAAEDPWLQMGESNAKDGYLVYRVPLTATDMMLVGSFGSWGDAAWRLT